MRSAAILLPLCLMLAAAALVVSSQMRSDPLAPFRGTDGRLTIPGSALTPELQRLLFGGDQLLPSYELTYVSPERSSYPTVSLRSISFEVPNLNVFVHPKSTHETLADSLGHLIRGWFPPVDWHQVGVETLASVRHGIGWVLDLFTMNARADTLTVDSTTVAVVDPAAGTCTTSQSAAAGDNAVLVMLSNRGPTAYTSVTYGAINLSLIPGTASSGTGFVRTEMWFYQGAIPGGAQTMTATLVSGTAKHICATVLLGGVWPSTPTAGGTTASGTTTNPNISIAPASAGELAFAVMSIRGTTAPTAVTGTGAAATSLYGIAPTQCTSAGSSLCGAGADMPFPGTAITWTDGNATDWVVAAVRVLPVPNCGVASGNCYRVGAGGAWNTAANWSNTSGGASCGCTPVATNNAFFNASPTGTTTLAAATTIARIDMTGFTGTLDTTASNWALTVNGAFLVQGTFLARNSTVTSTGDASVLTAGTIVNLGASTWTVNGIWTNQSTSGSWVAGTSTVTIRDAASGTLTFAALAGATNEFNNLTLDASVTTSITYTMATNALRLGGTLTIRNSTGGAAGLTILTSSASNLGITAGALTLATLGTLVANGSAVTVNGNVNVGAANAYVVMGSSTWTVTGTWTNASTSASWNAGTGTVTFTSATGGTMTFAGTNLPGNEFNNITFTSSAASAQTFTMATRAIVWGGTLTLSDGSSTTALATANLGLTGGALNVGNGGILTANASTIAVGSVTMTGGTSGTITLTTSSFTSSGNWDTSGAGSVFTKGTSSVTMTGVSTIAILNASNNFNNLTIASAGTVTQTGLLDVSGTLTVNAGASLATGAQSLTVGTLAANMAGGIAAGASGTKTIGGDVSIAATGFFNFGGATWNFAGSWTNSSTSASWSAGTASVVFRAGASQTMTFKATSTEFYNLTFDTTATAGVTYTMATNPLSCGGTLTIQNSAASPTGNTVLATGASNLAVTIAGLMIGANGTLTANASTITDNGSWTSNAANATFNAGTSTVAFGATGTITLAAGQSFYAMTQSAGTSTLGAALMVTGPMTVNGTVNTGASNFALAAQGGLTITGALITGTSMVAVVGNVNLSAAAAFITSSATGSWTVTNGNWTNATTSASWGFAAPILFTSNAGRSMTFAGSNLSGNEFSGAVAFDSSVPAGATYTMASRGLAVGGSVTIQNSAGGATGFTTLDSSGSNLSLTFGSVILATFGALNTRSSAVAIMGDVAIGAANAYVTNAGGSWTVSGSWTNASTSVSWSFAASVTFNSSASQTMTFGNLTPEFAGNVTFNSGASTVTFAMASNALTIGGTLTISGGAGTTTLSTGGSNLSISAATLNVNAGGSLAANGSLITVTSMDTHLGAFVVGTSTVVIAASGGTVNVPQQLSSLTVNFGITTTFASNVSWSVSLTLTGATLTFNGDLSSVGPASLGFASSSISLAGSWNTSSATAFTSTGSAITFTGSARTITLGAGQQFESLTIAGTVSLGYDLIATSLTVNNVSTLTKTGHSLVFNALTVNGTIADGAVNVTNLTVTNSDGTALVTISVFSGWAVGSSYAWTHTSSEMSQTITWTIGGNAVGNLFNVTKDGLPFASGTVNGAGQVVFTMLGSDPDMQVGIAAPCAGNRYWVQGSGNWNDSNHWASSSGGGFGCSVPGPTNPVFFDGNSASATVTISGNVSMASLNTSGFSGTIAGGAYDVSVSGNVTHAGGTITMGASTGSGFVVGGSLTLSGTSSIQMTGASDGSVSGNVSISSPSAFVKFGSGTWTFGGSWTNASTSASWAAGSGTIVFRASANTTMTFAGANLPASEFHHVTFDATLVAGLTYTMATNPLTLSGLLTIQNTSGSPTGNTTLTTSGSNLGITAGAVTIGNYGTLVGNGSTIQVGGNWTATGTNATFNPGTGSVMFTATATIDALQAFNNMTVSGGTSTLASDLNVNATLSISGGVLATSTFALSTMTLILSGGALTSVSGGGTVTGDVSVSAGSYIAFGAGTWTFRGSWANLSTSTSWSAGTGTVVFAAGSPQVMSFGNLTVSEFHNIQFSPPAAATFTMATNGLRWNGTLTLDNNAALVTANLVLIGAGGNLTILDGGTLTAGTSSVSVANVTMTGGTSGTITASGSWTVSGNWDTSGAGSAFVGIASTVLLTGPGATVRISNPANGFGTLTISGSISAASGIAISGTLTISGSLDTTSANYALTISGGLTLSGANAALTTHASNVSVSGDVTVGSPSSFIVSAVGGSWTVSGSWTDASTSASWSFAAPITFSSSSDRSMAFAALPAGAAEFGDVTFNAGASTVVYTMAGNALVWSGALRVQGGTGTTTLTTTNVGLVGGALMIGDGGVLMASASPVSVSDVTMTGGSSGAIVVTSGSWTVLGNWDSSGVSSTLTAGTSTMTFAGTTQTISVAPGQTFNHLTIAGTVSISSTLTAATLTVTSGAILTKTGHSIVFNALTVNGTIADGSVNVASLAVTNSDATALVTISVFGGWSAGSSYAWTHTSSEATQTITWTIGGNTAGHLFNVTKDGSSFASGVVNGSGQVVFTMLGSDPDMKVSVTPPPIPAWWQSPYVLAIPPIGLFVVVAMFAQRARWRPAKAFLVDERSQLLREFILDPSCQVTYEEAVHAGVLDAVEKPIKVAKYHGQTVRGDALSVVLLAYGPVSLEQVEFAREMLVRIQSQFEDAVKQRLDEARTREADLDAREARIAPGEAELARRETAIVEQEQELARRNGLLDTANNELAEQTKSLKEREAALERGREDAETSRKAVEVDRQAVEEMQRKAEGTVQSAEEFEAAVQARSSDLDERERRIAPGEMQLAEKTQQLEAREAELTSRANQLAATSTALENRASEVAERETTLGEDRVVLGEARAAFESDRRESQERIAQADEELNRRRADLDSQAKSLGESQLRLAQEKENFEASQSERNQAVLSREIEIEAREQSLREKEESVRAQVDENARRFAETAAREETLEIEGAKLDKTRADLEARKVVLTDLAKDLDGKAGRLREEEAKRAEERRTWQGTLESEQALLKQQRETFEEETSTMRASWADRVMRIEAREVDVEEREERIRGDTDRIAGTEEELKRRETATEEAARIASEMKEAAERIQRESEQRLLELESRERALREEAAHHAIELTKQTEGLDALESDIAAKRSDFEQLHAARTAELRQMETDLQKNAQAVESKGRELAERESRLAASEETFRQAELRLQREHEDVQAAAKQLESRELELTQLKDRYDSEAAQIRNELEGMRQSVAAKEAELRAERERIERDSSALQETLGAKAKEMALREKALTAREEESRADEQDLEARGRELESKERQTDARMTELSAQAMALVRREQDLNARAAQIEQTVRRVETEAAEKRREWESVQATLRSQQAQLTATTETRAADLARRTQEIEGHERTQRAWFAQFELERSKVEAQAKALAAKSAEAEAAWQRSEARLAELKAKENEILRARQAFESERSTWASRRAEELKQLEATRDAAGQQAQQAERLVSESQRRALIAEEAERAAKRQAADLTTQQASLDKRRSVAEKAEQDAQAHIAQLQEASRTLAMKEMSIAASTKDLEARQSRIAASEREVASREADLRSKKTSVDQDAARLAALSEQLATRQRDLESRTAGLEAKSAQMTNKEQTLATELQRADNLMEDLDKKEREIWARDEALKTSEATLTARESEITARDAELRDGTRGLEKLRQELNGQRAATDEARRVADTTREESEAMKRDAEKLRAQADTMQAEVATNLRFLQKKALDVLDQEEKIRERLMHVEEREKALDARAEILEGKERTLTDDQADLDAKTAKLQAEVDRLQARLADAEKAGGPSTAAMEEWKKDVENRVKIIQKKAMDLLDREEKVRKKEEELRVLAAQLGVSR